MIQVRRHREFGRQAARLIHGRLVLAAALAFGIFSVTLVTEAQQTGKVWRIAFLGTASPSGLYLAQLDAFRQGLRELGYEEGKNVLLEYRWANGRYDRLPGLAAELVRLQPDVLLTHGTPGAQAAKRATTTIPIVMATTGDAVVTGLVASLGRPGGNVTGHSIFLPEVSAKKFAILKEVLPRIKLVGVPLNPGNPASDVTYRALDAAARPMGIELMRVEYRGVDEFEAAFLAMVRQRCDAAFLYDDAVLYAYPERLAEAAVRSRLPTIGFRAFAEAGGLMAYNVDYVELWRRAAVFVDKILKGAKPGALPVEQATRFELVVNLKTAKALGLTIPKPVLVRADTLIE